MTDQVLFDNDVLLKLCRYSLWPETSRLLPDAWPAGVLGAAEYVLRSRISRDRTIPDRSIVSANLEHLLSQAEAIEPSEAELQLAAALETVAQQLDVALDGGESQLLAILVRRPARLLVTGDKRAIRAAGVASRQVSWLLEAAGRVASLEQLVATLAATLTLDVVRGMVCADAEADKALSNCFSCSSPGFQPGSAAAGLASYVEHTRSTSEGLLLPHSDLAISLASSLTNTA